MINVIDNGTKNIEIKLTNSYEINEFHPDCKICEKYGKQHQPGFIYCKLCGPELEHAMRWKKVNSRSDLPRDESVFLCLWKGRICMAQFDIDEGHFFLQMDPAIEGPWKLAQERECKITHWMALPDYPEDY